MTETTGSTATPESGNHDDAEDAAVDAAETEDGEGLSRRDRKRANKAKGGEGGKSGGKRAKRGLFSRIALYYRQIIAELRKVVWPTRSELMNYTSVVVVFVGVMMTIVATLDWGLAKATFWIFG
ncbi:preprotein translocase subunit SecE [Kitasatospora acidiphila]|uniref:Protein translocase subunit SecE n=1 Tax=Kitasatospora acidiphila TaxID=2567942 RepID=A0A540W9B8_9ACTN|nr:preprotein translocase subunit SecE [Kitasatospora acidiphila]TQF04984.1 preprotein translocase subunit SecE [Kitasatospora acidiphila]